MKKTALIIALVLVAISASGCKKASIIEGSWEIELEPMIRQAKAIGASGRDIAAVRDNFADGRMTIDASQIILSIAGIKGSTTFNHTIASKESECLNLTINNAPATHKYCVSNGRLEVHDPSTKLVAIYKKS